MYMSTQYSGYSYLYEYIRKINKISDKYNSIAERVICGRNVTQHPE